MIDRIGSDADKPQLIKTVASLRGREGDLRLSKAELECISLFQQLKKMPPMDKFPGAMVLRRFAAGSVICRQGEQGNSAFFILTGDDSRQLLSRRKERLETILAERGGKVGNLQQQVDRLQQYLDRIPNTPDQPESKDDRRCVAKAYLLGSSGQPKPPGLATRLRRWLAAGKNRTADNPEYIPNDGPTDINYRTGQAPMYEGDVFGEMSCMTLAPRSATVVAEQDCYMLEFLRNIFDAIQRDAGYKQKMDRIYTQRVLSTHLNKLELFRGLNEQHLELIREKATLETAEPGEVICDEGEPSDSVYIIRTGLVQVTKNVTVRLRVSSVSDWTTLANELRDLADDPFQELATAKPASPATAVADVLKAAGTPATTSGKTASSKSAKEEDVTPAEKPKPTAAKTSVDDILKAARRAKASDTGKPTKPAAGSSEKPSVDDVLAAARQGIAKSSKKDAAKGKPAAKKSATDTAAAKKPATGKPKSGMSVQDILQAARGGKSTEDPAEKSENKVTEETAETKTKKDAAASTGSDQLLSSEGQRSAQQATEDSLARHQKRVAAGESPPEKLPPAESSVSSQVARRPDLDSKSVGKSAGTKQPPANTPRAWVWQYLGEPVQQAVHRLADQKGNAADQELVIDRLNELMARRDFLLAKPLKCVLQSPVVASNVGTYPKGIAGIRSDWTDVEVRAASRLVLQSLYPNAFPVRDVSTGPPRILSYLSRGDCFGEQGVVTGQPRNASCIAYDHPPDDSGRKSGRVELVKIDREVFQQLLEKSPELKSRVDRISVARHKASTDQSRMSINSIVSTSEFRDAGFAQGQKLMLIDLDRCTNCGDCVRACINSHDDGYSRLYLDGPRFDRFLVPSACRNCRNPACMIGCPVGSIQRGDEGQIFIRDWCIGCELCARQCPYDSIQMQDIGLIMENSYPWLGMSEGAMLSDQWHEPKLNDEHWPRFFAPIHWDLDLQQEISQIDSDLKVGDPVFRKPLVFRHRFDFHDNDEKRSATFRLSLESVGAVSVWMNGTPVETFADAKQRKRGECQAELKASQLLSRGNVIAVRVAPHQDEGQTLAYQSVLLRARLDRVPEVADFADRMATLDIAQDKQFALELVTQQAVVCDLCSQLSEPACVAQCPHEAAMRIDARFDFPIK